MHIIIDSRFPSVMHGAHDYRDSHLHMYLSISAKELFSDPSVRTPAFFRPNQIYSSLNSFCHIKATWACFNGSKALSSYLPIYLPILSEESLVLFRPLSSCQHFPIPPCLQIFHLSQVKCNFSLFRHKLSYKAKG